MSVTYLNTDLILRSNTEPIDLIKALDKSHTMLIFSGQPLGLPWTTVFETKTPETNPKETIRKLLESVCRLPKSLKPAWEACERRTLDVGFQSEGSGPSAESLIPHDLVALAAELGLDIQITIYPAERPEDARPYSVQDNAD